MNSTNILLLKPSYNNSIFVINKEMEIYDNIILSITPAPYDGYCKIQIQCNVEILKKISFQLNSSFFTKDKFNIIFYDQNINIKLLKLIKLFYNKNIEFFESFPVISFNNNTKNKINNKYEIFEDFCNNKIDIEEMEEFIESEY